MDLVDQVLEKEKLELFKRYMESFKSDPSFKDFYAQVAVESMYAMSADEKLSALSVVLARVIQKSVDEYARMERTNATIAEIYELPSRAEFERRVGFVQERLNVIGILTRQPAEEIVLPWKTT